MESHVKVLGILYLAFGILGVLGAVIVLVVFGGLAGMAGLSDHNGDALTAIPVLGGIGTIVFLIILVLSLPNVIGGIGLLRFRPWARILVLILSALHLLAIPFGTALGIYGFWVLLNVQTEAMFRARGAFPGPPVYRP